MSVIPFPGDEGRTKGAHNPGNIRADGVAAGRYVSKLRRTASL
ncbi:MAG: hypothetical protein ACLTLQ_13805 [[Clostridium] scindens]